MNLEKYGQVAKDLCDSIEFPGLTIDGKCELFLFNIVYIWGYLQREGVVPMNNKNSQDYIATGSVFMNELKQSSNQSDLDVLEYFQLFKDRFMKHKEEGLLVRKNNCVPVFFFQCLFSEEIQQSEMFREGWFPQLKIEAYKSQVNNLEDALDGIR